jgi:hypothetical protein
MSSTTFDFIPRKIAKSRKPQPTCSDRKDSHGQKQSNFDSPHLPDAETSHGVAQSHPTINSPDFGFEFNTKKRQTASNSNGPNLAESDAKTLLELSLSDHAIWVSGDLLQLLDDNSSDGSHGCESIPCYYKCYKLE